MVRAITQIEQEITALEDEVVAIAQELSETYGEYLSVLAETVQQQLILTSYYLCTQGYPDRFLKLSLSQRQQLQQALQTIAKQARAKLQHPSQLQSLTEPFLATSDAADNTYSDVDEVTARSLAAIVRRVMLEKRRRRLEQDDQDEDDDIEFTLHRGTDDDDQEDGLEEDDELDGEIEAIFIPEELAMEFMASGSLGIQELTLEDDDVDNSSLTSKALEDESSAHDSPASDSAEPPDGVAPQDSKEEDSTVADGQDAATLEAPAVELQQTTRLTPRALAKRCDRLEQQIKGFLKQATDEANSLLQNMTLLPQKLPDAVLDAALKANLSADVHGSPPNLLHLIVHTEDEDEPSDDAKVMRIMALRLQVAEIEFNNPTLTAWRSRIRELAAQLRKFERDYRKLRREQAIAEAEAAWRSSWYESDG